MGTQSANPVVPDTGRSLEPWEREAARLLVMGFSVQETAHSVGVLPATVRVLVDHEPFKAHMQSLQARVAVETNRQHEKLAGLFEGAMEGISRAVERMQEVLNDGKPDLDKAVVVTRELRALVNDIADRLPGRAFTKVTRSESKVLAGFRVDTGEDGASGTRQALQQRMAAIDAAAEPTASAPSPGEGEEA